MLHSFNQWLEEGRPINLSSTMCDPEEQDYEIAKTSFEAGWLAHKALITAMILEKRRAKSTG